MIVGKRLSALTYHMHRLLVVGFLSIDNREYKYKYKRTTECLYKRFNEIRWSSLRIFSIPPNNQVLVTSDHHRKIIHFDSKDFIRIRVLGFFAKQTTARMLENAKNRITPFHIEQNRESRCKPGCRQ